MAKAPSDLSVEYVENVYSSFLSPGRGLQSKACLPIGTVPTEISQARLLFQLYVITLVNHPTV